jgi:hypothetical protein
MALGEIEIKILQMLKIARNDINNPSGLDIYTISEKLHNNDIDYSQALHGSNAAKIARQLNSNALGKIRKHLNPLVDEGYIRIHDDYSGNFKTSMYMINQKGIEYLRSLSMSDEFKEFYLLKDNQLIPFKAKIGSHSDLSVFDVTTTFDNGNMVIEKISDDPPMASIHTIVSSGTSLQEPKETIVKIENLHIDNRKVNGDYYDFSGSTDATFTQDKSVHIKKFKQQINNTNISNKSKESINSIVDEMDKTKDKGILKTLAQKLMGLITLENLPDIVQKIPEFLQGLGISL